MRKTILILATCVGGPLFAQGANDPGIRATIEGQLQAFRADDMARAFEFASPAIREIFRTPENFGVMVEGGYPAIRWPGGVLWGDQSLEGAAVRQRMGFLDGDGREHWYVYEMIQVEGLWKINGVYPAEAPDIGV